ncbi:MAG: DAK2 domain-containing protein [Lachnospiraceae bacterium]|nr:DAK2 domain-containing protein [Lachnospiraceae bacterium]
MKTIGSETLKNAFFSAVANLNNNREHINELNVFPVPDGDTGTNMTMTVMSAKNEVLKLSDNASIQDISKAIANGSLRGARGNSGVITSQIFRGIRKSFQAEGEKRDVDEIDIPMIKNALHSATETAYNAVMKPKEGTILTVIKAGSLKAEELMAEEDADDFEVEEFIGLIVNAMDEALERTPELLPVLKEAGVVDSGGMGLMALVKGMLLCLQGSPVELNENDITKATVSTGVKNVGIETEDIKFGYCTEFIIMTDWENEHTKGKNIPLDAIEKELKSYLNNLGDCVVVVADDDIVKVHVHTNDPGLAIQKALTFGQLSSLKIDNMREEHNEKIIKDASKIAKGEALYKSDTSPEIPENAFVSICAGDGLADIFKSLGVNTIVEGGQTMNPSTEDIVEAINNLSAKNVFIFPNNGNIILAANQAAELVEDKNVYVIPTVNIPQGIGCMINFVAGRTPEDNKSQMCESLEEIKVGQVTYAVRDTEMDGFSVKKDDYMGMFEKSIVAVDETPLRAALAMAEKMIDEDTELVSIYYGADSDEEEAESLSKKISEVFPEVEIEIEYGGQPVYNYIISVE